VISGILPLSGSLLTIIHGDYQPFNVIFKGSEAAAVIDFGNALWFTAMMMTTIGSDYWPQTPEGRILAVMLGVYAFTVFGYVTAGLASLFVGRDIDSDKAEISGLKSIKALCSEVEALRSEVRALSDQFKEERNGRS
jgi:voltage-gated potassium channel Kch